MELIEKVEQDFWEFAEIQQLVIVLILTTITISIIHEVFGVWMTDL